MSVTIQKPKPGYADRHRQQCLAWAEGRPYHNRVDDECTPDFSCCHPDMLETDSVKRWAHFSEKYGRQKAN